MLKDHFLKQTNLIKTTLKFLLKQIIVNKIIIDRFDFINKKCKLVNHKRKYKKIRLFLIFVNKIK